MSRTASHGATIHPSTGLQLLPLSLGLYQPLLSPCFHSCPHTLALHTAAGGSVKKVNQFMSLACPESSSSFLPIILGLTFQFPTRARKASEMQACADHPPIRVHSPRGVLPSSHTGLLAEAWALAVCPTWHSVPPYFPMAHSPPLTSTGSLLTHNLCASLAWPQTWTVYLLSNLKAWPREATQHTLSNHSSKETSSSYPAKNTLTPTKGDSYLRKADEIRTNHLSGANMNHSANTSDVACTHLCPQPGAPAPAPTSL